MKKIVGLCLSLLGTAFFSSAHATVVTLDFDTPAGGSNIITDGFVNTALGQITLFEQTSGDACIGCFGTFPSDLPFGTFGNGLVEAGSSGDIGLDFSFDVSELTFNFGGDGGGFAASILDINGAVIDSISYASLPGSGAAPGPHTFTASGIRALRFDDPIGGAAIDNLMITGSAAVPVPATVMLFALGLVGLRFRSSI